MNHPNLLLPVIDWMCLLACIAGALLGSSAGLARSFGLLLWTLAALWLGNHLSARVVDWMPNTVNPADPVSVAKMRIATFALIALLVLILPVAGRVFGGASGKKKTEGAGSHKPFGALTGLFVTVLIVIMLMPLMRRMPWIGNDWEQATSPLAAKVVADNVAWLFPDVHRAAMRGEP